MIFYDIARRFVRQRVKMNLPSYKVLIRVGTVSIRKYTIIDVIPVDVGKWYSVLGKVVFFGDPVLNSGLSHKPTESTSLFYL